MNGGTVRFAWWNTGVAPPYVTSKATTSHRTAVGDVLQALLIREQCALAALAEVRREDVIGWVPSSVRQHWEVLEDTSKDRNDFDVAILHDTRVLTIMDHAWVKTFYGGSLVRAGVVATFAILEESAWLIVAAGHWRSDAKNHLDAEARRSAAAEALRNAIVKSIDAVRDSHVLVLGDFNAEPYSAQFLSALPSVRSRDAVQQHLPRSPSDLLFYNAAWRWMGEAAPWIPGGTSTTLAGSYRTDQELPLSWRTFDQVLVSASLLRTDGWSLDERTLGLWPHDAVYDADSSRPRTPFDHVPIVGDLRWVSSSG